MATKTKNSKKQRAHKTSKGINGAGGKYRGLTATQKVLMGGGLLRNVNKRWKKDN